LKALEIITLFEKFRKVEPKENVNLFLQVCALVDQYQDFDRRFQWHTEKTVSEYLKTKVV
jgi:hypothetical protein